MWTHKRSQLVAGAAVALLVLAAIGILLPGAGRGRRAAAAEDFDSAPTPVGGLLERMSQVSRLKQQMGELRAVWPAMSKFAELHQGLLPTNCVELRPYLPANLSALSDERWELPSAGLVARPVLKQPDAILLQQKNVLPGKARIVLYGDGHIEYKK